MTTTSELRSRLESQGEEISNIAHEIEHRIEEYTDWESLVRQYPLQSLGVAAGVGLLLSGAGGMLMRQAVKQVGTMAQASITAAIVAVITNKTTQSM